MAKRYSGLYAQVCGFENLFLAWRAAAKGKRGKPAVAAFEWRLEENLLRLQGELEKEIYRPGSYRSFYIRDPKQRLISAAPVRDRVVHHALCRLIEPVFERTFIGDSYANRLGKGTHAALQRAHGLAKRYPYVLQCDVRRFFPGIDHELLKRILERKFDDEALLRLCGAIIDGGAGVLDREREQRLFPGDDLLAATRPAGLPIGNLTSQLWANVYLNELDQFVKRRLRCRPYLRYMDDFLLFAADKPTLWAWRNEVMDFLAGLRLSLHEGSSTVFPVTNGIPFLGFRVFPTHTRLKRRNGIAFQRRFRRKARQLKRGDIEMRTLTDSVRGWVAHAAHGDTYGLRRALLTRLTLREL